LDFPVTRRRQFCCVRSHFHDLLVKERRKKKELVVPKTETLAAFRDPAFAQQNRLFAATQRFANQRPFLETDTLHFAPPKLASPRCPSTSTSTPTLFSPATAFPARRRTS